MGLSTKLLLFGALVLLSLTFALLLPTRVYMREQIIEDIQNQLTAIAATAALQIDGDMHQQVAQSGDGNSPEFRMLRDKLRNIRDANGLAVKRDHLTGDDYLYTFSFGEAMKLNFAVMTHDDENLFIGDAYRVREHQAVALAEGRAVASGIYADEFGQWIAAAAPLRTADGGLVGLLEVAQPASVYFARYDRLLWISTVVAVIMLVLAAGMGYLVLRRLVIRPLDELRAGMSALGRQDFSHRVKIRTRDELEELGDTLNDLFGQLNAARVVQSGFLPGKLPESAGYRMAISSEPCDATGGDYVDAFALDDGRVAVIVADVTGHGLGPSLLMATCRAALRAMAHEGLPPGKLLTKLERLLLDDLGDGRFITMIYGVLDDTGRFIYANAGHGPALVRDAQGVRSLGPHRPPLGIVVDLTDEPDQTTIQLHPGDRLLLASDGVSEAKNPAGSLLGLDIIREVTAAVHDSVTVIETLQQTIIRHRGTRRADDDVTMLCIDRLA